MAGSAPSAVPKAPQRQYAQGRDRSVKRRRCDHPRHPYPGLQGTSFVPTRSAQHARECRQRRAVRAAPQGARRRRARAVAQAQRGSEWRQHCCCLRRIHALRNHGLFTPPSLQGSIVVPYFGGGSNWGGMAYDPQSHLAILNAMNLAGYARLFASGDYAALKRAGGPDEVAPMIGAPFGMRPVLSYGVRPALAPHTGSAEPKR
jgi:glucose dehydrogenase